jgi:hypothetical protein
MTRLSAILLCAGLAVANLLPGMSHAQGATRRAAEEALPVPPIPPEEPLTSYEAAPVPGNVAAPVTPEGPRGAELSPRLMGPKQFYQGEGFLTGSTVQSEQQRKAKPAAGFNLTVPLR